MDDSNIRGTGTWRHCRGCTVQKERADRIAAEARDSKDRQHAAELRVGIVEGHVRRLEREVVRTHAAGVLRVWSQYCRDLKPRERAVQHMRHTATERAARVRALWQWRAHTRECAWRDELGAAMDALQVERNEVSRLRETVFCLQQALTGTETTKHRMAVVMTRSQRRAARRRCFWSWKEAVRDARVKLFIILGTCGVRWRLNTLQRKVGRQEIVLGKRGYKWRVRLLKQRTFATWRRRAAMPLILESYRKQIEALQSSMKLLHLEVCSLRLFKDAVTSTDAKVMRRGGGYIPFHEFISKLQNKVASAMVKDALTTSNSNPDLDRYGLGGAVAELAQSLSSSTAPGGFDMLTPRGGVVEAVPDGSGHNLRVSYTPAASWMDGGDSLANVVVTPAMRARAGGLGAKVYASRNGKHRASSPSAAIGSVAEPHRKISMSVRRSASGRSTPSIPGSGRNSPHRSSRAGSRAGSRGGSQAGSRPPSPGPGHREMDFYPAPQREASKQEWDSLVRDSLEPGDVGGPTVGYGGLAGVPNPVHLAASTSEGPRSAEPESYVPPLDLSPKRYRDQRVVEYDEPRASRDTFGEGARASMDRRSGGGRYDQEDPGARRYGDAYPSNSRYGSDDQHGELMRRSQAAVRDSYSSDVLFDQGPASPQYGADGIDDYGSREEYNSRSSRYADYEHSLRSMEIRRSQEEAVYGH